MRADELFWSDHADMTRGKRIFMERCAGCHAYDAKAGHDRGGPNLVGIIGRRPGRVSGFEFSDHLQKLGTGCLNKEWTDEKLLQYMKSPARFCDIRSPGVSLCTSGLPFRKDRVDVLGFLRLVGKEAKKEGLLDTSSKDTSSKESTSDE